MSNLLPDGEAQSCTTSGEAAPLMEALPDRAVQLGALEVHRVLPVRGRRMIGPWCFLDRFGPLSFKDEKVMDVAPHPHIGLQTVTWLLAGEIVHNDSLGSECLVHPGRLSLMTAGRGIAHTEETPVRNSGLLDGVQFWVALPERHRHMAPQYQCTREQAVIDHPGGLVTGILGDFGGAVSTGNQFSPGVGAEIAIHPGRELSLPLDPGFEYGVMLVDGDATVFDTRARRNTLYYLGAGRGEFGVRSSGGARVLLIGGPPFGESILMWWNFVARTAEEIQAARQQWENREGFGDVPRYNGPRLTAPAFLGRPIAT